MFLLAPFSYWSNEMSALPSCNVSFSRTSRLYATLPFQQPLGELGPKMASEWTGASIHMSAASCSLGSWLGEVQGSCVVTEHIPWCLVHQ